MSQVEESSEGNRFTPVVFREQTERSGVRDVRSGTILGCAQPVRCANRHEAISE